MYKSKHIILTRLKASLVLITCLFCIHAPEINADILSSTATYEDTYTLFETEEQTRIIALTRSRLALFKAFESIIRDTQVYQNSSQDENLAIAFAASVTTFETQKLDLKPVPKGYQISLVLIGSINTASLEENLGTLIKNRFLYENSTSNRAYEKLLMAELDEYNKRLGALNKSNQTNNEVSLQETLITKRQVVISRIAALAINDAIILTELQNSYSDPARKIKQLNRAIALDDRNAWFYLNRGLIYRKLKDFISASADFERAELLNPYIIHSFEFQGDVLLATNDIPKAIQYYTNAIALDLEYHPPLLKRSRAYRKTNKPSWALKDLNRVVNLAPNIADGYHNRGETYIELGDYDAALADYDKLLSLNPEVLAVLIRRGEIYQEVGNIEKGCQDFYRACELGNCDELRKATYQQTCVSSEPLKAEPWSTQCYEAVVQGDWEQAIQAGSLAIYYNPNGINPYINRAWAFAEIGFFEEALADVNQALILVPNNTFALNNRGLVYERKGDREQASNDYLRACELGFETACKNYLSVNKPKQNEEPLIEKLLRQGGIQYRDKQWQTAINLTTQAIQDEPMSYQAYAMRAAAFSQIDQYQKAINDCNRAIQINPSYGLAYNNRGYALERMNKREEALVDYRVGCLFENDLACQNYDRLEPTIR